MVVSDYTAIDQIPGLESRAEKAAAAINAGNDVDFPHGANYAYLQEAIDNGTVKLAYGARREECAALQVPRGNV